MTIETNPRPYRRRQIHFTGKGRTKQASKDECDINKLMARYAEHGQLPATNPFPAQYGDFSEVPSYQEAVEQVAHAKMAFADLPSAIRTRFGNDPQQLLAFMADPSNQDEAEALGLAEAKSVPTPPKEPETPAPETPKEGAD